MHRYLTLVLILLKHSGVAQECPVPQPSTPVIIHVRHEEYRVASLKSRLISVLTDSLIDEGRGLGDVARERQIQKLMKQIKEESIYGLHGPNGNNATEDLRRTPADSSIRTGEQKTPNSQTEMQRNTTDSSRLPNEVLTLTKTPSNACLSTP